MTKVKFENDFNKGIILVNIYNYYIISKKNAPNINIILFYKFIRDFQ